MLVRNATLEDLPKIVEIYNTTIASRIVTADINLVTIEEKTNWFQQHLPESRPLWLIEDVNNIIGWCSFQDFYGRPAYSGTAEISIYIDEAFRKKGYGKKILSHAISQCNNLKINTLLGFIFEKNAASLQLFLSMGFKEWGNLHEVAIIDGEHISLKILGKKINQ